METQDSHGSGNSGFSRVFQKEQEGGCSQSSLLQAESSEEDSPSSAQSCMVSGPKVWADLVDHPRQQLLDETPRTANTQGGGRERGGRGRWGGWGGEPNSNGLQPIGGDMVPPCLLREDISWLCLAFSSEGSSNLPALWLKPFLNNTRSLDERKASDSGNGT